MRARIVHPRPRADIGLDRGERFVLRPQVDYFGFRANGSTTGTVRFCVGVVFRIGRKQSSFLSRGIDGRGKT
jgi:hypothetical protein